MLAEDPLEAGGKGLERGARAFVQGIRLELDPHAAERLEGMPEQEELRLGVRAAAPGRARVPGPADLEPAMLRTEGQVAGAADRPAACQLNDGEGNVQTGVAPGGRVLEPAVEALAVGRRVHRKPPPDLRVLRRLPEVVLVLRPERLDDDEPTLEPLRDPVPH